MKHNFIYIFILTLFLASCNKEESAAKLQGSASGSCSGETVASGASGPLFKIDGMVVKRSDLPKSIEQFVYKNEHEAYLKNQGVLKELALRIYLAKKQGKLKDPKNPPEIKELMSFSKATEKEAKEFFKKNKKRMPPTANFKQMKAQLLQYMDGQKMGASFREKMTELESKGLFTSLVAAPVAPELKLDTSKFPTMGNKSSKVSIIEVSDYLCGHCQKAHPLVKKILKKYKNKVSFTQVNFSLRPAGLSGTYVRGAYCAEKQNKEKFWTYHNAAFEKTSVPHDHSAPGHSHNDHDGNSKDAIEKVSSVAKTAGLDLKQFADCLKSDEANKYVQETSKLLNESGVNSTPVFIVNNKKLAQGVEELEKAIKEAL